MFIKMHLKTDQKNRREKSETQLRYFGVVT